MKHIFIVNPISGQTDAVHLMVPQIIKAVSAAGVNYQVEITRHAKHSIQIIKEYLERDKNQQYRFYAVGGDGTLKEVFTAACWHKNAQVASIPCGSGNDFVRNFGTKEDFLNIGALIAGKSVDVDLVDVNGEICASITSVGLDADVAHKIPRYRRLPLMGGSMAYNISIIHTLLTPLSRKMRITIDGKSAEGDFLIGTVCNGRAYGGGFNAAPLAQLNDGVLEVVLVKKISRLTIAKIIGKYKKGQHFGANGQIVPELSPFIKHYSGKQVLIEPMDGKMFNLNMDGECINAPQLKVKVLPGASKFVLPAHLVG